jgi:hypothetical protein
VLQRVALADLDVPDATMSAALDYIREAIARGIDSGLRHPYYALSLRVLSAAGMQWPQHAGSALYADRQMLGLEGKTHLAVAYGLMDPSEPRIAVLLDEVLSAAVRSSTATHWEAIDPEQWTTDVQVTSTAVGALISFDRDNAAIAAGIRWLLAARGGGEWGTAYERAWALSALADYDAAFGRSEDRESNIDVRLNGRPLGMFETDADSGVTVMEGLIPLGSEGEDDGPRLRRGVNVLEIAGSDVNELTASYTGELNVVLPIEPQLPAQSRGLAISRRYCLRTDALPASDDTEAHTCVPADKVELGQLVDVRLTLTVPDSRHFVDVVEPTPAGFEVVTGASDARVCSADHGERTGCVQDGTGAVASQSTPTFLVMDFSEKAATYLGETVPPGTYDFAYTLRSVVPGRYTALPATAAERYFPEVRASTGSDVIEVAD